jgi:hypothetical protein
MSQLTTSTSRRPDRPQLDRLCTSIRGKLQFMDYLVRAAVADAQRLEAEDDAGARIFLRQLVEMHTANLSVECENMRLMGELCSALESALAPACETVPAAFRSEDAA